MNLPGQFAIFPLVSAWFPLAAVVIATDAHPKHAAHPAHRILLAQLCHQGITQSWLREKMASASDNISEHLLIFRKNICTIRSGEAQWGRSLLATIPQNPANALELDS